MSSSDAAKIRNAPFFVHPEHGACDGSAISCYIIDFDVGVYSLERAQIWLEFLKPDGTVTMTLAARAASTISTLAMMRWCGGCKWFRCRCVSSVA